MEVSAYLQSSCQLDQQRAAAIFTAAANIVARLILSSILLIFSTPTLAQTTSSTSSTESNVNFAEKKLQSSGDQALAEIRALSNDIQQLKTQVVVLNKDLRNMEEQLLYPSSTKYTVFVSIASGHFFDLEGIKFKLDGEFVASHIYSEKQRNALVRGGVHRLYITNLSEGKHTATVFFTGIGSNQRDYKRAVSLDFDKGKTSEYLEIAISDDGANQEPIFELKQR
ncbi:AraC family transcriptional regulator [Aurantivibrio plasticivorans]